MLSFASSFLPNRTLHSTPHAASSCTTSLSPRSASSRRRSRPHLPYNYNYDNSNDIIRATLKPEGNVSEISDEEVADLAEVASIDRLASEWIGSSIPRWEWYERIKSRRQRLRRHVKLQEAEVGTQIDELRTVLLTLDALLDIGLIEKQNNNARISIFGWMLVLAVSFANFVFAFIVFELFSNIFVNALNVPPF